MPKGKPKPIEKYMPDKHIPNDRSGWGVTVNQQRIKKKMAAKDGRNFNSYEILDQIENIK